MPKKPKNSSINETKSGKEIWLQTTLSSVMNNKGEVTNLIAVDSDITIIKKAEIQIKEQNFEIQAQAEELKVANEKLKKLNKFKEEMTGMIVHDLKNPLNSIIGLAENDIVKQSGKRMLNMVMNLLDIQKFEDTNVKLQTKNHFVLINFETVERVFVNILTNAIKYTPNN